MKKTAINTDKAPAAIGTYSQAVKAGGTIYLSGQIPLNPVSLEMVEGDFDRELRQVFDNLLAVTEAANASFDNIVKLNIYLTDLGFFVRVNEIMAEYFSMPYPARAAIGVAALPRGARVEIDGVLVLPA